MSMRKILSVSVAVILAVCLTVSAFADMGGPIFVEYEAYVSNPDGARTLHDDDVVIPYEAEVTVISEYGGECNIMYEDEYYSVKMGDLSSVKEEVKKTDAQKYSTKTTLVVMDKDGVDIRKGPGYAYEAIGNIPEGTEFTVGYGDSPSVFDGTWSWISYKGTEGWIYSYPYDSNYSVAVKADKADGRIGRAIVLSEGLRLMKNPSRYPIDGDENEDAEFIGKEIPVGTELRYKYYYPSPHQNLILTEYKGVKGWLLEGDGASDLYTSHVTFDSTWHIYVDEKLDITEKPFGEGKVLGSIPAQEGTVSYLSAAKVVNSDDGSDAEPEINEYGYYSYDYEVNSQLSTYYVSYSGVTGWITEPFDKTGTVDNIEWMSTLSYYDDVEYYADEDMSEGMGKIPAGSEFVEISRYYERDIIKVAYDGKIVYVYDKDYDFEEGVTAETEELLFGYTITEDYSFLGETDEPASSENDDEDEEDSTTAASRDNDKTKIIIGVAAAAAIVVLTAVVIIVLINKKKKA